MTIKLTIALLFLATFFSCAHKQKLVANYKVTPYGYVVWRYSKVGEPKKDIMSNGDTLVTTVDTMFIRRKQWHQ
jgi:hypothetical protein